jgi:hypothetical protein
VLDGHDECQLDGLLGHRVFVWVVRLAIGLRLEVQHLGARSAGTLQLGGDRRTVSPLLEKSRQALVAIRCSHVRSDAPLVGVAFRPCAEEGFLGQVLGVLVRREHPIAVGD